MPGDAGVAPSPPYASRPHQAGRMCRVALENPPAALDRQRDLTRRILPKNLTLSADRHFTTNAPSGSAVPVIPRYRPFLRRTARYFRLAGHAAWDFSQQIRPIFSVRAHARRWSLVAEPQMEWDSRPENGLEESG